MTRDDLGDMARLLGDADVAGVGRDDPLGDPLTPDEQGPIDVPRSED